MYPVQKIPFNERVVIHRWGFTLIQQNGQRTYGGPPPNWPPSKPAPSRDCEVFIGRLPRTCYEDELIPLFLRAGELYEFRLMLDFSGTNRGYGYAHYTTPQGAANAIKMLNKYVIRPKENHQIGVLKSKNNCRLLFGNIKPGFTQEDFENFIRAATDNVLEVIMFANYNDLKRTSFTVSIDVEEAFLSRLSRGDANSQFAIVEYENHKAAAIARRVLIPKFGQILSIDWAVPPKDRKRNLYDNNIDAPTARAIQGIKPDKIPGRNSPKPRPVPSLVTSSSIMDNVPFMPKNFDGVCNYFKYLLGISLFNNWKRMELPWNICSEIQEKIVDPITNLENCSQAVQLILNYLAWYNEKKPQVVNVEMEKVLDEVKVYSDAFVKFVMMKTAGNYAQNAMIDEYYTNILPNQLNTIHKIAVLASGELQTRLSGQISVALQWFQEMAKKSEQDAETFIAMERMRALSISDQKVQNFVVPRDVVNQCPPVERRIVGNGNAYVQDNRYVNNQYTLPRSAPVPILRSNPSWRSNCRHSPDSGISIDFQTEPLYMK